MENQANNTGNLVQDQVDEEQDLRGNEETPPVEAKGEPGPEESKGDQEPTSFMELYEESLKSIQEGSVVTGEIVKIDKEFVLVDIGYKSEGQIPISEFLDSEGNLCAEVGDKVDVLLEREDEEGGILLSKEKAAKIKIWDEIQEIYEKGGTIRGKITARVKGGMSVDIGIPAFLPGSQINLKPIRDFDSYIGTVHDFKILKYNKRRSNIVLSRRAILEAERAILREKTLKKIENGAILDGTVKNITEYGLFIDLGGIDGLLHITDMSWGRVGHPSEMYQIGDKITVKVLNFDPETERVSLGLKQLKPDPWTTAEEKYPIGTRIRGRVVSLADYGAFVEVEEGIEGLIHVSEMSWTRKIRHPSQVLKVGDVTDAMVLNIDAGKKRISLGLKQCEPNPWDVIGERYPVGTTIEGRIKNITDFGIFIGIDEGIDGLVHISDISWTKRIKHPSELYKKGQEVQAVVLNIDKENERFSLGIKQLTPDPWDEVPEKYRPGTRVTGTVTNITDFGIFVELEEGIEGLIHVSELAREKGGNPLSRFNVDDVIQAKVINVSRKDKKIGLSIRKLEESEEKEIYRSYMDHRNGATSNLGELLRKGMMDLQNQVEKEKGGEEKGVEPETSDTIDEEEETAQTETPEDSKEKETEENAEE
ncbi:MAG: 30S ribosomal protein S1 [Deltaproteobacteria bacterium]|nr:30S ribosomal protein S1 [Deltaproteobacteria bacterium]MBW2016979.1 30S ribosomal protein S1 [Deltaproteobacteria bacterium]MBW2130713.1 30S ribosomal protein S1 [Deltaproteobacteria bacterium]MBW2303707.1 30S ribosomal protein S1 [Deltaproteobacteria bacterium]